MTYLPLLRAVLMGARDGYNLVFMGVVRGEAHDRLAALAGAVSRLISCWTDMLSSRTPARR